MIPPLTFVHLILFQCCSISRTLASFPQNRLGKSRLLLLNELSNSMIKWYKVFQILLLSLMWWNTRLNIWSENVDWEWEDFCECFEWKTNMAIWLCKSVFYQIISEIHLQKYQTFKGHTKFQNPVPNFRRCIFWMSTKLTNYHYICWKYPKMHLRFLISSHLVWHSFNAP